MHHRSKRLYTYSEVKLPETPQQWDKGLQNSFSPLMQQVSKARAQIEYRVLSKLQKWWGWAAY